MRDLTFRRRYAWTAVGILSSGSALMIVGFGLGLLAGPAAAWTKPFVMPVLAVAVMVSTTQIPTRSLFSVRALALPTILAIVFGYLVQDAVLLGLARWLIADTDLWIGCVVIAIIPPAIAVVPYTDLLEGNNALSLLGIVGAYLASLVLAPLIALLLLGRTLLQPFELFLTLVEVILIPLALSRVILASPFSRYVTRWRGAIANCCFAVVVFSVVGLNRDVFLRPFDGLLVLCAIGFLTVFVLGHVTELVLGHLGVSRATVVSLTLFGTLKNAGMASAVALTLFGTRASVPAAIITAFQVLYFIWQVGRNERGYL